MSIAIDCSRLTHLAPAGRYRDQLAMGLARPQAVNMVRRSGSTFNTVSPCHSYLVEGGDGVDGPPAGVRAYTPAPAPIAVPHLARSHTFNTITTFNKAMVIRTYGVEGGGDDGKTPHHCCSRAFFGPRSASVTVPWECPPKLPAGRSIRGGGAK